MGNIATTILTWLGLKGLSLKIGKWLFNRYMKKAMKIGANQFREKYPPINHAHKSRKYMWKNYWQKMRNYSKSTKHDFDNIGMDFIYYYNACWIEDGILDDLLKYIERELDKNNIHIDTIEETLHEIRVMAGIK